MLLHIQHETTYRYERLVKQSVQSLRLTPRTEAGQRVLSWALQAPGRRSQQLDAHGNVMHLLTLDEPHDEIVITVTDGVAVSTCNGEILEAAQKVPATGPIGLEGDAGQMEYRRIRVKEAK